MKRYSAQIAVWITQWPIASQAWALDNSVSEGKVPDGLLDVKGPFTYPGGYWWLIFLLILLVAGVIAALIYILHSRRKEPKQRLVVDDRFAWDIAIEQLNALGASSLLESGQFKLYYSQLADIIRGYFERRFNVRAPEMTTEEFLWSLEPSGDLTVDQKTALKNFMNSCDIVKFAKYVPNLEEARESLRLARVLVDETKAADIPPS